MTFLNLMFLKIMPSIQRLGADVVTAGVPNFFACEVAAMLAPQKRYYGTSIVCFLLIHLPECRENTKNINAHGKLIM